jgi:hypothetical protein
MAAAGVALAKPQPGRDSVPRQDDAATRAARQWDAISTMASFTGRAIWAGACKWIPRDLAVAWFGTGLECDASNDELPSVTR